MYICMHKQIVSMAQLCDGITDQVQSNGRSTGGQSVSTLLILSFAESVQQWRYKRNAGELLIS